MLIQIQSSLEATEVLFPYFTDEEMEAQRSEVACLVVVDSLQDGSQLAQSSIHSLVLSYNI